MFKLRELDTHAQDKNGIRWGVVMREVGVVFVATVVIAFLLKTYVVRSFYIPSGSMENTLMINDRVIVNELQPRFIPISRGDVVVFSDPGGWLSGSSAQPLTPIEAVLSFVGIPSAKEDGYLIKRVIGLPGDRVACCTASGRMTVNGVPIDEHPYLKSPELPASEIPFSETVPANSLWVMGDNRNSSGDSRYHRNGPGRGFVHMSDVVGRAFVVSWPIDRWNWLDDFPSVFTRGNGTDAN